MKSLTRGFALLVAEALILNAATAQDAAIDRVDAPLALGIYFTVSSESGEEPFGPRGSRPDLSSHLESLADFQKAVRPYLAARSKKFPSAGISIERSVYHVLVEREDDFSRLAIDEQYRLIDDVSKFIAGKSRQQEVLERVVIGPGRKVIALLGEWHGLVPKQVKTISEAYEAQAVSFKLVDSADTAQNRATARDFLNEVQAAAASGEETTVVVIAHGRDRGASIGSGTVSSDDLANAIMSGARRRAEHRNSRALDFGNFVFVFDVCWPADFSLNLQRGLISMAGDQKFDMEMAPLMIAGADRGQLAWSDSSDYRFQTRFWGAMLQIFYIESLSSRRPLPGKITVGDLTGKKMATRMHSSGRQPVFDATGQIMAWKTTDPKFIQDPVFFIPLRPNERAELRRLLAFPQR